MTDCIFCKIAAGEIPSSLLYEDDEVVAFDDLSPQAPVHSLIIPRAHYENIGDAVPPEILTAVFAAVPKVARIKGIDTKGYRLIVNTGHDAGQTVPHFHVHLLGGIKMSEGMLP
jgi:histidine triad (HIT) family protein